MQYNIDVGVSRVTIKAFASGMLSAFAHNPSFAVRRYDGKVLFDPEDSAAASLTLHIDAPSMELIDDVSAKDRQDIQRVMHDEVLEDAKYPKITYEAPPSSASVKQNGPGQFTIIVNGTLTLHNSTRRQPVTANVTADPKILRASGEFSVRQTDYGIKLVSAAGGAIKVKDELKCTFDLVARP